jgi:DNA polymerase-3 subunit epsilon
MGPLSKETFICLDCETTGLDPEQDRIVEIAVVKFTFSEILGSFETLIDPERDIPQISQEIHKIRPEMVQGKPKIGEALPQILSLINAHPIVGHGIHFDLAILNQEAKRASISTDLLSNPSVDTLRLARLYGESPINSLERLREHFNIPAEGAHRAMNDVIVNIEVFKRLSSRFRTLDEIHEILRKPIRLKLMPLGKHKGRKFDEIPIEYLLWAEKKDFDQDLLFSIRSEIRNRKKGGGFEQAGNPFSSL